jgi:putative transposase
MPKDGDGAVERQPRTVSSAWSPTGDGVAPVLERLLREQGLPRSLRMDNGPPFASTAAGGLTRLSVPWVKLGIALERIAPGQPQQNGRHERMHKTLKAETTCPPAADPAAQQARFDAFRHDFNEVRPHEALAQTTLASCYRASPRPYPTVVPDPVSRADEATRRVRSNGEIKWGGELIYLSESLIGEPVGISETETGDWLVRFADIHLGTIDRVSKKLRPWAAARPSRRPAEQTATSVTHVAGP